MSADPDVAVGTGAQVDADSADADADAVVARAVAVAGKHGARVLRAARLPSGRHAAVRVDTADDGPWLVKLQLTPEKSLSNNVETAIHEQLAGCPAVRPLIAAGPGYLVLRYAEGRTLLDLVRAGALDPVLSRAVTVQVAEFLRACAAVRAAQAGDPGPDLTGTVPGWGTHLRAHLEVTAERVGRAGPCRDGLMRSWHAVQDAVAQTAAELDAVQPALVPLDLNLANVLVGENGKITVLDLETFWCGDPLLGLGEWTAHTHGMHLHRELLDAWGPLTTAEHRRVRCYALLALLDLQLFVAEAGRNPLHEHPWGNPTSFGVLAALHRRALTAQVLPEDLLRADPALVAGLAGPDPRLDGMGRAEDPAITLARLEQRKHLAGITRVAEVTGLDATGVSVHQSTRPAAEEAPGTFTVFAGRGADEVQSRLSSLAEAMERFCAERTNAEEGHLWRASAAQLRAESKAPVVGPEEFNLPAGTGYRDTTSLEWARAIDLLSGTWVWVPACTVFSPCSTPAPLRYFTTGLGASTHRLEAAAHGLAEALERDAAALNHLVRACPAVLPGTITDRTAADELARLEGAGLDVVIRWIAPDDINIPVFSVLCTDRQFDDPIYINGGYGAHPDRQVALVRALREAAASRAGTISGAREDLDKFRDRPVRTVRQVRERYRYWFDTTDAVSYSDLPDLAGACLLDDLTTMVDAVACAGFERVLVVELTRPELGLQVVKVLVPGLERYSFRFTCVGRRARTAYLARYGRPLPLPPLHRDTPDGSVAIRRGQPIMHRTATSSSKEVPP